MNKIEHKEVKRILKEDNRILLDIKVINNKQMFIMKDIEDYKYVCSFKCILNKSRLYHNKFGGINPYSYDNQLNYLKINNINTKLISTKTMPDKVNSVFKCGKCGCLFERVWGTALRHNTFYCNKCRRQAWNKHSLIEISNNLNKLGYVLLDDNYIDVHHKLKVMNNDGYKAYRSYSDIIQETNNTWIFNKFNPYLIENINNYIKIHNISVKLLSEEVKDSQDYVKWQCSCGNIFTMPLRHLVNKKRFRCTTCSRAQSQYELKVENWLITNNINYLKQYQFEDCKLKNNLRFDFYIQSYGLIEVDGAFHFQPMRQRNLGHTNNIALYKYTIKRDEIKNEYCKNHNIKLLRISYKSFNKNNEYKQILENELKSLMK